MYLILDPGEDFRTRLIYSSDGETWAQTCWETRRSGGVLAGLRDFLASQKQELSAIQGLVVRVGVGRFTATRVAVVVANTLHSTLGIALGTIKEVPEDSKSLKEKFFAAVKENPLFIHPSYSAEPHLFGVPGGKPSV